MDDQTTNEPQGNIEANVSTSQETTTNIDTTASTQQQTEQQSNDQQQTDNTQQNVEQQAEGTQTKPEMFKLGESEYTLDQIIDIVNSHSKNGQTAETQQSQTQQMRDEKLIESDIERINQDRANETATMLKRYLALANPPTNNVNAPYEAIMKGINSGDFTEFISYLNPVDVATFINEQYSLNGKYEPEFKRLDDEKNNTKRHSEYQNNLKAWDDFLAQEYKDNPAVQAFFAFAKNTTPFDKEYAKQMTQEFNKAVMLANNSKMLSEQTEALKKAMSNSVVTNGGAQTKERIYTVADIENMSQAEFNKNYEEIKRQEKLGLIK
jgi:hypothetical protein